jgi:hypothetical protein
VRLRPDFLLALFAALAPLTSAAQPAAPLEDRATPARSEVRAALEMVKSDPNLAPARTVNMLRWAEPEQVTDEPWWWQWANAVVRWFRGFFGWIAESGRYVIWVAGALLGGLLLVYVVRLVRGRGLPRVPKPFAAPSHVRDLDIRPASLPDDVGSAARTLWQRGDRRAALALLYRGSLSRLVHVHGVPIRASATEGECLALARPRLAESSARYVARLVETWAAAVYGGLSPAEAVFEALCSEFRSALDRSAGAA